MNVTFDCYRCIYRQILMMAESMTSDTSRRGLIADELMKVVLNRAPGSSPPEMMAEFTRIELRETGIPDHFVEVKRRSTELGLKLLDELKDVVESSDRPFETALKLAIGGNIIDYGATPDFQLSTAEASIRKVLDEPLDCAAVADLERRMDAASSIFYMLDNCGEAVLDRLLVERYRSKVTIGVRGRAVLNDVTRSEAALSGYDGWPMVDTGDNTPGVSLRRSSPEFIRALRSSDLVICKGQGNFESLEGEFDRPVYYLLRIKCRIVSQHIGVPQGTIAALGRNLPPLT